MRKLRLDDWIRSAAIATMLGSVSILLLSVLAMSSSAFRATLTGRPVRHGYSVGNKIDLPTELFERHERTLVLFIQSGCGACQESVPFFHEIVHHLASNARTQAIAVVEETEPDTIQIARDLSLPESQVIALTSARYRQLQLAKVPTLLFVSRDGTVVLEHVGRPDLQASSRIKGFIADLVASDRGSP